MNARRIAWTIVALASLSVVASTARDRIRLIVIWLLLGAMTAPTLAQVFSSEFFADPVSEGWNLLVYYCDPETWNEDGWYHQQLDHDACPPGPRGAADACGRSLEPLNGVTVFFLEFRLETDGDRSGIPYNSALVVALGNSFGVNYHVTVARDLVRFLQDVDPPVWFEIEPDAPHTYRIELYPERYAFYVDADLIDEGVPGGSFPAHDSRITWIGESWDLPCENAWDYIRYGVIPVDGIGDYDSDGVVTHDDFYFFHECLANIRPGINGGPDNDAGPGCRFADFDSDGDTDLLDFAEFQNAFTSWP